MKNQKSEMFYIQTFKVIYLEGHRRGLKNIKGLTQYIYCPVSELKYVVTDMRDKDATYGTVVLATRCSTRRFVEDSEIFGEEV